MKASSIIFQINIHITWSMIFILLVFAGYLYGSTQEVYKSQLQERIKVIKNNKRTVDSSQIRKYNVVGNKGVVKLKGSAKPYTGLVVDKYTNGQKQIETTYEDGKKNGPYTEWYWNGQKKEEGAYKDGREHGLWNGWNPNGQKKEETHYENGQAIKSIKFYTNGQKLSDAGLNKDGNDMMTEWYDNGKKKSETILYKGSFIYEKKWDINGKLTKRKKIKIRGM